MKHKDFSSVCNAVEHGEELAVEHRITHQHGKVIACEGTGFEVATADGDQEQLQHWEGSNCEIE
ncbi:MAG TPA: hypothetical protein VJ995_08505 [Geothermobacteraceae bacterium]|nr:hypothetical protein [Geothermobacteraceae bacterium]